MLTEYIPDDVAVYNRAVTQLASVYVEDDFDIKVFVYQDAILVHQEIFRVKAMSTEDIDLEAKLLKQLRAIPAVGA